MVVAEGEARDLCWLCSAGVLVQPLPLRCLRKFIQRTPPLSRASSRQR